MSVRIHQTGKSGLRLVVQDLLSHASSTKISKLSGDQQQAFDQVEEYVRKHQDLPPLVEDITSLVDFNDGVSDFKPGTVLAYLVGCFHGVPDNLPASCLPFCPSEKCDQYVYWYDTDGLMEVSKPSGISDEAYVYCDK